MGCALAVVAGSPAAGCGGGVPSASAPIARTCESLEEQVVTTGIRRKETTAETRSVELFSPKERNGSGAIDQIKPEPVLLATRQRRKKPRQRGWVSLVWFHTILIVLSNLGNRYALAYLIPQFHIGIPHWHLRMMETVENGRQYRKIKVVGSGYFYV
jgi:hypothetical protein